METMAGIRKPIYTFRGIVKVGYNMMFCLGSWPFSRMDFFEDEIVVHVLGFKKRIPYKKIIKLAWTTPVKYGGYSNYVGIIHEAGGYPYVAFRLWTGRDNNPALITMCKILKSKGIVWDEIKSLK